MAGVPLPTVKEILGHRDLRTTLKYAHFAPGHLKEAVERSSVATIGLATGSKTGSELLAEYELRAKSAYPLVRPAGLEPATPRSVVWCSIH